MTAHTTPTMTGTSIAVVDVETTGLEPGRHHVWEVAIQTGVIDRPGVHIEVGEMHRWFLEPNLSTAEPAALAVGRYYTRAPEPGRERADCRWHNKQIAAADIARLLDGRTLVGINPAFDAAHLASFLRHHGQAPTWSYHLLDVAVLAIGALAARDPLADLHIPWRSDDLATALGLHVGDYPRHTAAGDVDLARDMLIAAADLTRTHPNVAALPIAAGSAR
jgi:DNA polymerase III epsilon subunit-like protein